MSSRWAPSSTRRTRRPLEAELPERHAGPAATPESAIVAAIGLSLLFAFGDGSLGLSPPDLPPPSAVEAAEGAGTPRSGGSLPITGAAAALALAVLAARRSDPVPGDALALSDPVVVFVPGHGQGHGSEAFADLVRHMGIEEDQARFFDYRWVDGQPDASWASSRVPLDEAAQSLNAYVAGVAEEGRPVYLIGFSKGGATLAELVADWDDGHWGRSDAVIGAALLDPPIAAGPQGFVQSLGRRLGPVPDDGGYDPVRCTFLGFGCEDRRVDLGRASGVEVVVIRNPKAAVTSFADVPRGLRVYDAPDPGPTIVGQLARNPLGVPARIAQAHEAVLRDRSVAECIVAEMRSGRCDLQRRRRPGIRQLQQVGRRSGAQYKVH